MALSHRHMRPNTDISAYDLVRQSIRARLRLQTQTCDVQAFAIWKQPGRAPYASTGCPTTWDYALQNDKVPLRLASRCNHQPGSGLCGHRWARSHLAVPWLCSRSGKPPGCPGSWLWRARCRSQHSKQFMCVHVAWLDHRCWPPVSVWASGPNPGENPVGGPSEAALSSENQPSQTAVALCSGRHPAHGDLWRLLACRCSLRGWLCMVPLGAFLLPDCCSLSQSPRHRQPAAQRAEVGLLPTSASSGGDSARPDDDEPAPPGVGSTSSVLTQPPAPPQMAGAAADAAVGALPTGPDNGAALALELVLIKTGSQPSVRNALSATQQKQREQLLNRGLRHAGTPAGNLRTREPYGAGAPVDEVPGVGQASVLPPARESVVAADAGVPCVHVQKQTAVLRDRARGEDRRARRVRPALAKRVFEASI